MPAIVCPEDHLPLAACADRLACANGHRFDIRLGIPRIVSSEPRYADTFGEQWNKYRRTQLDSHTGTTISKDRLTRCLGEALWKQLSGPSRVSILEIGCGAGRFSEVLLQLPSACVTATDLSSAVEANHRNCPPSDRYRIIQCDVNALPFSPGSYNVVLCLGVIQHTPNPESTIAKLYAQTRPGGWLVFDHYRPSLAHYTKITALLLRPVLKRLSPRARTIATEGLVRVFLPLHRMTRHSGLMQIMVSRVSPLLTYYRTYPELDDELQYEWALLDTHDSLADYYKHFRTRPQIASTLSRLGATDIRVAKGGNGIEARCRKPVSARG
jgi:2-polyprenyl-3-methyl-5-hydroxy-6-metoxy-1,4-benzoquinol methylase